MRTSIADECLVPSIADVDSGDWSWVDFDQYPFWQVESGVLSYTGQEALGPVPQGEELLDWPDGAGIEFHVTLPFQGPAFAFSYVSQYLTYTQITFEGYWTEVKAAWTDSVTVQSATKSVDSPPAFYRVYRRDKLFVFECRASVTDDWTAVLQSPEMPDEAWNGGWRGLAIAGGPQDWHSIRGITVAGGPMALRVRMPDESWLLTGVANSPIYVRVKEGDTEKWKAYAGGGGPDLAVRVPGGQWATVSTAGGVYGILRGRLKKAGVPLASRPVWINRKSDPDYSIPMPGYQTATDDQGLFEIAGFPLGDEYHMRVQISDLDTGGMNFTSTVDNPLAIATIDYP